MKFKMTDKRLDDTNSLLKTHGDSLTAFYDEGICYGKKWYHYWSFSWNSSI